VSDTSPVRYRTESAKKVSDTKLRAHAFVHDARVGFAPRFLHHLADEEAEQAFLAASELLRLAGVRFDDLLDDRVELVRVGDDLLLEIRRGRKTCVADLGECLVERGARDLGPGRDELRKLTRIHGSR
jgi:hypothetical protein